MILSTYIFNPIFFIISIFFPSDHITPFNRQFLVLSLPDFSLVDDTMTSFFKTTLLCWLFNPIYFWSPPIFKKLLLLKLSVLEQFKVHSKIEGKTEISHILPTPPSPLLFSSFVISLPHQSSTIGEPTFIHHNHLKSTVYITVHSCYLLP